MDAPLPSQFCQRSSASVTSANLSTELPKCLAPGSIHAPVMELEFVQLVLVIMISESGPHLWYFLMVSNPRTSNSDFFNQLLIPGAARIYDNAGSFE